MRNFYGKASEILGKHDEQEKTEQKLVKLSFSIVTCFIFTYCFENTLFIIASFHEFDVSSKMTVDAYVKPTINLFMTLNPSINIIFYCIFSKTFKTTLFEMFHFGSDKNRKISGTKTEMTNLTLGKKRKHFTR